MAADNKLELVIEVDVNKANASIKSVNAGLSSMEQTAARTARTASQGIDGITVSMAKGAAAGAVMASALETALGWVKEMTVETAKYAARTEVLGVVTRQLAAVNDLNVGAVESQVKAVQKLGITTQEAHTVVQKMIFAQLDLSKATELARVAQNAAVIAGVDSSEASENIILGITTGQTRLLHNMGIQVSLDQTVQAEARRVGHELSEQEKRAAMLNRVLQEGAKIDGTYEAAMGSVGKQMTSLNRYFKEAKDAVGQEFLPEMRNVVPALKDAANWIKANASAIGDLTKSLVGLGFVLGAGFLTSGLGKIAAAGKWLVGALNPVTIVLGTIAVLMPRIVKAWQDLKNEWANDPFLSALRGHHKDMDTAAAANLERLRPKPPELHAPPKPHEPTAEEQKLAADIRKHQAENERYYRDQAVAARGAGLTGFAKDMAEINTDVAKRTTVMDDKGVAHFVSLTKATWSSLIDAVRGKFDAFKKHVADENKKLVADYLKDEEEAAHRLLEWDTTRYEQWVQHENDIQTRTTDNLRDAYSFEEQRAGFERDARLRQLEGGTGAQTIQEKIAIEQQKAQIEIDYLEKVHEVKQRLYDLDTSRMVMEEELTLQRLGYHADEIKARIADLTQQRETIREQNEEAHDAAVQAVRENASNRATQIVVERNRQVFDSLKQQAGGVFDALLTKSQSVWAAIGNSFKTAILTAIKEVVTSRIAAALMGLFTGQQVSFAGGSWSGSGSGSGGGGILGGIGGLLGVGAAPVFGGTGGIGNAGAGGAAFGSGPVGGNPMVLSATGGLTSKSGVGMLGNLSGLMGGIKDFFGVGGSVQISEGMATTWEEATLGQKLSSIGKSNAALLGGSMLLMNGLQRGGGWGVAESAAGGAMIGFKYGGPLGALIGGIAGGVAGLVRLFVKTASEKAQQKIKDLYGVNITDKKILKQIVDMAKQGFGGDLDVAIRSQQVRDLVQLYAMSTGQPTKGMPATMQSLTLAQIGGSLYQTPVYQNGAAIPGLGGLPTLDSIGAGVASGAGPVVIQLDGPATTSLLRGEAVQAIASNPRAVQGAVMSASRSNAGRRQLTSLQLSPGLVTV